MEFRQVFPDAASLMSAAAEEVADTLEAAVRKKGRAALALAGGTTPRELYQRLGRPPLRDRIPWVELDLFWGDERCVPADDPASNYKMVQESLLREISV